jgi:hypothetical protein
MSSDYNLLQCNPKTLSETRTTCLPHEMLIHLRDEWNKRYPADAIPHSIRRKDTLWAELRKRLNRRMDCSTEFCAVKELGLPETHSSAAPYFRPERPAEWAKNPTEWHDTYTISRVMEQYEDANPHFEFIGPVPIDFDTRLPDTWGRCIVDELCSLNLSTLRARGDHQIGIIFNLDAHDKPGSHWVCAYLDLLNGMAYYYDSYGYEPPAEVRRLLRRCREQGCKTIVWNDVRHQRKNTECGTYCMYVIISLLQGRSFADICKKPVNDDTMNAMRDLLYATERPRKEAAKLLTVRT